MTCRKLASVLGLLLLAGALSHAAAQQPADHPTLLALSKQNHTLALIDPATLQVLATLPVGNDPHEVIASTDGRIAYVSNYGFGAFHTLARVDLVHRTALPAIDLGPLNGPHGLAFTDGKLWFTAEGAKAIGSYNPATGKVDWILGTGQNRTHMIHVSPGAQHIITSNVSSGTVSLIDREPFPPGPPPTGSVPLGFQPGGPMIPAQGHAHPGTAAHAAVPQGASSPPRFDWNETVVQVGKGSEGFDLSPDGKEIWVANAGDGTISVIDYPSRAVVATLHVNVQGANRLKFTPDGRHVLVSTLRAPGLTLLDAHTRTVLKRVPIGHGAAGILIEPGGRRAFIACTPDNTIAVLDLSTLTITGHIDAGPEPDGLAWSSLP